MQMRWMLAVWRAQRGALQGPDRQLELFGLYSRFYLALMLGILFSWRLAECALLPPPPSPSLPSPYREVTISVPSPRFRRPSPNPASQLLQYTLLQVRCDLWKGPRPE